MGHTLELVMVGALGFALGFITLTLLAVVLGGGGEPPAAAPPWPDTPPRAPWDAER